MRRTLISVVLTSVLLAGFWPLAGMAEGPPTLPALGGYLEREAQAAAITLPSGFGSHTPVSGLTDPRGVVPFPPLGGFPSGIFVVEKSLNRVSFAPCCFGAPTPFATGLAAPTDLTAPPDGGGAFGNFLYVAESGANRISRINNAGVVTPFASLPATPKRMALERGGGSAFGDFLFVTLGNGTLVKINPSGGVTTCVSGLAGPEGLVFGPGGSLRNNILYVAESTANRISKVDPGCARSDFATSGLSAPLGLEISQTVPWGPLDTTLYVVNAGTKVDRVDQSGNVTPFASGFTQADTVHFDFFSPPADRLSPNLRVSDAAAGTIVDVFVFRPFINVQLAGCNPCQPGQTFAITLRVANPGPIPVPVEIKSGFRIFDGTPINLSPLNDKHFEVTLPPAFDIQLLWLSFPWPAVPPGRYCYQASLTDPELSLGTAFSSAFGPCFKALP